MSIFKRLSVCDDLATLIEKYDKVEALSSGSEYPAAYYKGINKTMRDELRKLAHKHSGGIY